MKFIGASYKALHTDGLSMLWYLGISIAFCYAWLLYKIYATLM